MTDHEHETNADAWIAAQPPIEMPEQCDAYWWADRCYRDLGHEGEHATVTRDAYTKDKSFFWTTDESPTE